MNPQLNAVRAGLQRGRIELRQNLTSGQNVALFLGTTAIFIVIMFIVRNKSVPGTHFSFATMLLPSVIGMNIGFNGLSTTAGLLVNDREDGTLLRAKAIPNGMIGYFVGKVLLVSAMTLLGTVITLAVGTILFRGLSISGPGSFLTLVWVIVLGLVATIPLGAALGSLFSSSRGTLLVFLPTVGLIATSGIFYPITHLPHWLQVIGQIFPLYWLGLGMRSVLLPHYLAAVEIGGSWRHTQTFLVLILWAALGISTAPVLLRRMARRESGSAVSARRERVLQRPA